MSRMRSMSFVPGALAGPGENCSKVAVGARRAGAAGSALTCSAAGAVAACSANAAAQSSAPSVSTLSFMTFSNLHSVVVTGGQQALDLQRILAVEHTALAFHHGHAVHLGEQGLCDVERNH